MQIQKLSFVKEAIELFPYNTNKINKSNEWNAISKIFVNWILC